MDRIRKLEINATIIFLTIMLIGIGLIISVYVMNDIREQSEDRDEEIRRELSVIRETLLRHDSIILEQQKELKLYDASTKHSNR